MAIWEKLFNKITFKDYPDISTPINADNLNKMTDAIDGIDDRVVELNSNLDNKQDKLLATIIGASGVARNLKTPVAGWTNYAEIPIDYSSLGDVTIYSSSLIRIADDNDFTSNLALGSMTFNGSVINKVGIFSTSYKTARVAISVLYKEN